MAFWAQAASAAIAAGGKVLGGQANKALDGTPDNTEGGLRQAPGFHNSGNVTDSRGLGPIDSFLGSPKGALAAQVGGQFLGDFRQRRANKNRFKDLKDEGLTAQEIAGGSSGGSVQAQGNTLGSGPQQQAAHQQAFQADQADKERKNRLDVERLRQGPQAPASRQVTLAENIQPVQMEKIRRDMAHTLKQMEEIDFRMDTAFPMRFAGMGPENMLAAVVAARSGVDVEAMLRGRKVTAAQSQAMDEMFEMTQIVLAKGRRELKGTMDIIKAVAAYSFDNFPQPPGLDATKIIEMLMNLFERDPSATRESRTNTQKSNPLDRKFWSR